MMSFGAFLHILLKCLSMQVTSRASELWRLLRMGTLPNSESSKSEG